MSPGCGELLTWRGRRPTFAEGARDGSPARSPWRLFWRRFRRDRVALVSLGFIALLIVVAIAAPLVVKLLGLPGPDVQNPNLTNAFGSPLGPSLGAPVRRRPARPGRRLARDLRHARVAGGRHPRHRDRDADRRRRRACSPASTGGWIDTAALAHRSTSCWRSRSCCSGSGSAPPARCAAASAARSSSGLGVIIFLIALVQLDVHRADRARPRAVAARAGVRARPRARSAPRTRAS